MKEHRMKRTKQSLKDIEFRTIAELMKNSRRSDRELAKAMGISQPTVSRTIKNLEREDVVQEYTMIPNLKKIGDEILAMTFVKLNHTLSETLKVMPLEVIMLERGLGMDFDGVIISCHESYSTHTKFLQLLKTTGLLDVNKLESFLINLRDKVRFVPLTFSLLAQSVFNIKKKEGVEP
jgi:DNA-binding Lrp family transcriptional regulator